MSLLVVPINLVTPPHKVSPSSLQSTSTVPLTKGSLPTLQTTLPAGTALRQRMIYLALSLSKTWTLPSGQFPNVKQPRYLVLSQRRHRSAPRRTKQTGRRVLRCTEKPLTVIRPRITELFLTESFAMETPPPLCLNITAVAPGRLIGELLTLLTKAMVTPRDLVTPRDRGTTGLLVVKLRTLLRTVKLALRLRRALVNDLQQRTAIPPGPILNSRVVVPFKVRVFVARESEGLITIGLTTLKTSSNARSTMTLLLPLADKSPSSTTVKRSLER